jgi:hypothetical protein
MTLMMFTFIKKPKKLKAKHKKLVLLKFSLSRVIYTSTCQPAYYFLNIETQFTTISSILHVVSIVCGRKQTGVGG